MKRGQQGLTLDADARDAVERFVWILLRCGFSKSAIQSAVEHASKTLPKRMTPLPPNAGRQMQEAEHLITLWHLEPAYVGRQGEPRKLRRHGRAPSFESLARSVKTDWDTEEVLRYLIRCRAVRRSGAYYTPTRRAVVLMGFDGPATFRNVRGIAGMLRTNAHNLTIKDASQGWFERNTENRKFPVSKLPEFAALLHREGMGVLERLDAYMRTYELSRVENEPTVALGVGIYRYQQDNEPAVGQSP